MRIEVVYPASDARALKSHAVTQFVLSSTSLYTTRTEVLAWIGRLRVQDTIRVILVWDEDRPAGWLLVGLWGEYASVDSMPGSSAGWPTVRRGHDEVAVGRRLLGAAEHLAAGSCKSLLSCIDHRTEIEPERLAWLRAQYAELGYSYTDLVHYIVRLESLALPPVLPNGVRVAPLREADPGALADCVRAAFSGQAAGFFFGTSARERERFLAGLLASPAAQEPASCLLYVTDALVGFLTSLGQEGHENLLVDWMGLRPEHQRRGLGSLLLRHALAVAAADRYRAASGSANVGNVASRRLLESLGWEIEGGERQFVKVLA